MLTSAIAWAFCVVAIFVSATGAQSPPTAEVQPPEQVVLPGQEVRLMCRTGVKIAYCRVESPMAKKTWFLQPGMTDPNPTEPVYDGKGYDAGQCGMLIRQASIRDNGVWKCTMAQSGGGSLPEMVKTATIIVAQAPAQPELDLSSSQSSMGGGNRYEFIAGKTIHAKCRIPNGRPAANITWFLDDQPVTEGLTNVEKIPGSVNDTWTVLQNLTREAMWQDNGKYLRCASQHVALTSTASSESRVALNVTYPPQPHSTPIEKFGFEIGQEGVIKVEIQANPRPRIVWEIDGTQIQEGSSDSENRYHAEVPYSLGTGKWQVSLRIALVEEEDMKKQFTLRATNNYGTENYKIALSTSSEPTVMELGAGSIIGIVVAILFVLLVIFLVIFARATGRWCFAARGPKGAAGSHTDSEAHIDPEGQHKEGAGVGTGADNPSANHNASSEYINGNKKEPIKDDKDTPV